MGTVYKISKFPFLFRGTFIEGQRDELRQITPPSISLPFQRDFH